MNSEYSLIIEYKPLISCFVRLRRQRCETKILLFIFGIASLFISCGSNKRLAHLEPTDVIKFSLEMFNGDYRNKVVSQHKESHKIGYDLWRTLYMAYSIKECKVNASDSAILNLEFVENRLFVRLIEKDEVIQEIVLKAKPKEGYLSIKRKYILIPILPILFAFHNNKIVLTNMENGNLLLKLDYSEGGVMIIMASGNNDTVSSEFAKIIDN